MERVQNLRPPGDDEIVRELIEEFRDQVPPDIKEMDVHLDQDWTGDPAVYIIFRIQNPDDATPERAKPLAVYSEFLTRKYSIWD